MSLFSELKRRNVFQATVAYVVTSWLVISVADILLDAVGAPDWVMRTLMAMLALGIAPVALFSWAYEITPEGIKRDAEVDRSGAIASRTGQRLIWITIGLVVCIAALYSWDRYQRSPVDEAAASSATGAGAAGPVPALADGQIAIAVLPFVNFSSDPEQEYFSDGISEELLNVLAQIPELKVAARTSSFQFKGENRDVAEIARLLRVNHILEGSVRKAGSRLRITAQLIAASSGYHIWSETYDRELDDVFAVQDEISAAIGQALRTELGLDVPALFADVARVEEAASTAAYDAFLHGRFLINQRGNAAILEAVSQLEKSIRLDPNYAPAHAHLAIAVTMLHDDPSFYGDLTLEEVNARATPHIETALTLNAELAAAWGARALLALVNGQYPDAIEFAEQALEFNPVYIDAMNWIQNTRADMGDYLGAEQMLERMLEIDPLSVSGRLNYLAAALVFEDTETATRAAQGLIEDNPWAGFLAMSFVRFQRGDIAGMVDWELRAYAVDPADRVLGQLLASSLASLGLYEEALRVTDSTRHLAAMTAGRIDDAIRYGQVELTRNPSNPALNAALGVMLYLRGEFAESLPYFATANGATPTALVPAQLADSVEDSARYAYVLLQTGREDEAGRLISAMQTNLESRGRSSMAKDALYQRDLAMLAALQGNDEEAVERLQEVANRGVVLYRFLDEPIFASLRSRPEFESLVATHERLVAEEREATLRLLCENNPIPDAWQPLPETCSD